MKSTRPLWLRVLRFAGIALLVLVTVLALVASWLSFSGRRDWARTKADLLARGEKLSLVELAPAPVPDAENFFADPMWRELSDYQQVDRGGKRQRELRVPPSEQILSVLGAPATEAEIKALKARFPDRKISGSQSRAQIAAEILKGVDDEPALTGAAALEVLAPCEGPVARIHELLARPHAVFPVEWGEGFSATMGHMNALIKTGQVLGRRARAHLAVGDSAAGYQDVLDGLRLSMTVAAEPTLISRLVQISLIGLVLPTLEAGLAQGSWTENQIAVLQDQLSRTELVQSTALALRGERGFFNGMMEVLQNGDDETIRQILGLEGVNLTRNPAWLPLMRIHLAVTGAGERGYYNRLHQAVIEPMEKTGAINRSVIAPYAPENIPRRMLLTRLALPALENALTRCAETQDRVTLALTACALERFRLAEGHYPATLAELAPTYLAAAPLDVVTRQPLRYERTSDGFRLWTPGWDEDDDRARPADKKGQDGDWVWGSSPR